MHSIDIANLFILRHGSDLRLTNLSLNKLVYFAQVESFREHGKPLFSDPIEAWDHGPVEPNVYHAFKRFGRSIITEPLNDGPNLEEFTPEQISIVDNVAKKYSKLSASDLVRISHREGGAWRSKYAPGKNATITNFDIIASTDSSPKFDLASTFFAGAQSVQKKWPNALRLLEDA